MKTLLGIVASIVLGVWLMTNFYTGSGTSSFRTQSNTIVNRGLTDVNGL